MVDMHVVMTLFVPAKVLCDMWSYVFYDIMLRHRITAMLYDKNKFSILMVAILPLEKFSKIVDRM